MSVQKKYFDKKSAHSSPVIGDLQLVKNYDEDGAEMISFIPVDYSKLVLSNGLVEDWNLNNLLSAGINPDFPIHTGFNNRLEGIDQMNAGIDAINSLLDSTTEETPKTEE